VSGHLRSHVYHKLKVDLVCGDITDVTAKSGTFVADSQCNMACDGDSAHSCGGFGLMNVYYWPEMNIWRTPGNTGHYEVSISIYLFAPNIDIEVFSISVSRPCTPS